MGLFSSKKSANPSLRLPPLPPEKLSAEQKSLHEQSVKLIKKSGLTAFKSQNDEGALLGPWTVTIRQPEIGEAQNKLIEAIGGLKKLSTKAKQVAILAVGAHYGAAYELYAHVATAKDAGMDEAKIRQLAAGTRPDNLTGEEAVIFDVATALVGGGVLAGDVYLAARDKLGEATLYELVMTVGLYAQLSIMLNAYDVPAEHAF